MTAVLWPIVSIVALYVIREGAALHFVRQANEADARRKHELAIKATSDVEQLKKLETEMKTILLAQNMKGLGR
jgi:hypothetical protein